MQSMLEFANVICRFGDNQVLIDYAQSIVIPAFVDPSMERKYAGVKYFFHDTRVFLEEYNGEQLVILAGRFVKDMVQESSQYYEPNVGIVRRTVKIKDAPTSIFIFILNSHKLLFINETAHAPGIQAFKSTMSYFIRKKRVEYIEILLQKNKEEDATITKKNLQELIPIPIVEIIPLSSSLGLQQFVDSYMVLKSVRVRILNTNHEEDDSAFWRRLRDSKKELDAKSSDVSYNNNKGLNRENTVKLLGSAVQQGNTEILLKGQDFNGDTVSGNNADFKMRIPFYVGVKDVSDIITPAIQKFNEVQGSGLIKLPEVSAEAKQKALILFKELRGNS